MYYHCIANINSTHLFIAGRVGHIYNRTADAAYIVDTRYSDFNFIQLPNLRRDRVAPACGAINDVRVESGVSITDTILIVAGGDFHSVHLGDTSRTTEKFKLSDWNVVPNTRWEKGPQLPRSFYQGGYVSNSQHPLILVGGANDTTRHKHDLFDDILELNYEEFVFQTLPGRLKTPRKQFAVTGVETEEDC